MNILIAEDDFTSRATLAAVLRKCGHEVTETCTGLEAWEVLRKPDAPRLAILDWMMPGLDGLEVCRRVRLLDPPQPPYLILLTSKEGKASTVEGLEAGADDYMSKPFDFGELRARVDVGRRVIHLQQRLAAQVRELRQALNHIKTLQGILPICAHCKKIRDDQGYWSQVEAYVSEHSAAQFSHSICPDCMRKHYAPYLDHPSDQEVPAS